MNLDGAINLTDIIIIAKFFNKATSNYMKYYIPLPVIGSDANLTQLLSLAQNTNGYYTLDSWSGGVSGGAAAGGTPVPAAVPTAAAGGG
jgi:hypothetical protein